MDTSKIIIAVAVVVALALGGYLLVTWMNPAPAQPSQTTQEQTTTNPNDQPVAPANQEIPQTNNTTNTTNTTTTNTATNLGTAVNTGGTVAVVTPKTYEITYTDSGFSPSTLTVKKGDTVVFKNQSTGNMWVGSANHPSHTIYNGSSVAQHCPDAENDDFDQCQNSGPNTSWLFTFTKTGSWGYHNHVNASKFGKITVE